MTLKDHKSVTIMVTGGHLTPAVATIEELQSRHPDWRLLFVGRSTAFEGAHTKSEEEDVIRSMSIPFIPIVAGRLKRDFGWNMLRSLLKIPVGLFQAIGIIAQQRPTLVLSFGGYVALPICCAAYLFRIPVITHEQTMRPGLANRIIAWTAKAIAVSFLESKPFLSGFNRRVEVTGLPVRRSVLSTQDTQELSMSRTRPILLIAGGSTGSVSVNALVFPTLLDLLREYTVIHQVGKTSYEEALRIRQHLPQDIQDRYMPYAYLSGRQFSDALHASSLFIGRSGANTVVEVALAGVPAIWIPLPWAASNEQWHNAKYLENKGTSIIWEQKKLTPHELVSAIRTLMESISEFRKAARLLSREIPRNGAERLVRLVEDELPARP